MTADRPRREGSLIGIAAATPFAGGSLLAFATAALAGVALVESEPRTV